MTKENICWRYKDAADKDKESKEREYEGEGTRQIDPLTSEIEGHTVYLMPANCTNVPVIEEKEGFKRFFNLETNEWFYKEEEKEKEPEPYKPTPLDEARNELYRLKGELQATDYKCLKFVDGCYTEEEYAEIKAQRQALRDAINAQQAIVDELEAEESK